MSDLRTLADKLDAVKENPRQLRFSVMQKDGWITSSSKEVVELLCEVYNHRHEIAEALRK